MAGSPSQEPLSLVTFRAGISQSGLVWTGSLCKHPLEMWRVLIGLLELQACDPRGSVTGWCTESFVCFWLRARCVKFPCASHLEGSNKSVLGLFLCPLLMLHLQEVKMLLHPSPQGGRSWPWGERFLWDSSAHGGEGNVLSLQHFHRC